MDCLTDSLTSKQLTSPPRFPRPRFRPRDGETCPRDAHRDFRLFPLRNCFEEQINRAQEAALMSPVSKFGNSAPRASPRGHHEAPPSRRTWAVRAHPGKRAQGGNADVPGDSMAAPASGTRSASRRPATVARGGPYSVRTLTPLRLLVEQREFPPRDQKNPERERGRNSQDHQKRAPPAGQSRRTREEQGHSLNSFIPS